MRQRRIDDLGGNFVTRIAVAQHLSRRSTPRGGVARLDHETGDHAVEQQRIEKPFARQLQEIIAVEGCPVVERNADVARSGMQQDFGALLRAGLAAGGDEHRGQCGRCDPGK